MDSGSLTMELLKFLNLFTHQVVLSEINTLMYLSVDVFFFLARLHEVHIAIAVTPVVYVFVFMRVRVTLALKFSRSPYLDNHSSESIHTWTIDTL